MRPRGRRGRRGQRPAAREGDVVIDGRVRARLLGLPLLDLEAHVVVTPAASRERPPAEHLSPPPRAADGRAAPRRLAGRPRPGVATSPLPGLARAEGLLAEGAQILDEAGRIH